MAALDDGTYIMLNAASCHFPQSEGEWWKALAVDIPGASERFTGDQIWLYNRNDSAAQFVKIFNTDDGYTYITFILCNKVMAPSSTYVENGTPHIGYKNSEDQQVFFSNLVAIDNVGSQYARWHINGTGEQVAYVGTQYEMFEVKPVIEESMFLKVDKDHIEAEQPLYLAQSEGIAIDSLNARWVFLPMAVAPPGVYQIHLRSDVTNVLASSNKSEGSRIKVDVEGDNANNTKVWAFQKPNAFGHGQIINLESEKALTVASVRQGANVIQKTPFQLPTQLFAPRAAGVVQYLEPGSDKRLDEETWPTYVISVEAGSGTPGISAVNADGVTQSYAFVVENVNEYGDGVHTQFFLVPTSAFDNKAPVPDDVRHYSSYTGEDVVDQWGLGSVTVQPTWIGSGEDWSCRYQYCYRTASMSNTERSGWTPWTSIEDGKIANYGWGYMTQPNCQAGLADGRWRSERGITFSFENDVDLYEIHYEVRRFSYSYRDWNDDPEVQPDVNKQLNITSHSGSAARTCTVAKAAYLTLADLRFTGEGVSVRFGSTFQRVGNAIRIWSEGLFEINESNAPYFGTLSNSRFERIPLNGDNITVYWTVTTIDGITTSSSQDMVAYCAFDDEELPQIENVTVRNMSDAYLKVVSMPSHVSNPRLWITLDDDVYTDGGSNTITATRVVEVQNDDHNVFNVPYPFNRPFSLKAYGLVNGLPQVWSMSFDSIEAWTRLWNWGVSENTNRLWFEALYNESEPPTESVNTSASTNFQEPANGSWEIGHIGHAWSQSRSIAAVEVDAWNPDAFARLTAMSKCRFAWYRSPRGELMRVGIVKVNEVRHHDRINYTIEMRRVRE